VSPGTRARTWVPALLLVAGLIVVTLLVGAPKSSHGNALDPASTQSDGTKALVLLLRASGADAIVSDGVPSSGTEVAVLLADTTSRSFTAQLERWVEAGGVLVVADHYSSFAPPVESAPTLFRAAELQVARGSCDVPALVGLDELFSPTGSTRYRPPAGSSSCFADASGAFVVDTPRGRGHIVSVGTPDVFTNAVLDQSDNAGLAVALMAPVPGHRVDVLYGMSAHGSPVAGQGDLGSLVPTGVKLGLVELVLAFGLYAWWRGRRLGKPVIEHQPVQIAGSELVSAHGNLLQQTREPDRAARVLRRDLRRRLGDRLGIGPDAPPQTVAEVTASRTGVPREQIDRAVTDLPVRSEEELLALARDIDAIRTEVLHGAVN
jgi:hypothetical protein